MPHSASLSSPLRFAAAALLALALPLAAQGGETDPPPVLIHGTVRLPGGAPASGGVVVSSAGGQAAVGADGAFTLSIALADGACAVELTAVATTGAETWIGRRAVDLPARAAGHAGEILLAASEGCAPEWLPAFGATQSLETAPVAMTVFDDGNGPALYVAGKFGTAWLEPSSHLARWDGSTWSELGPGIHGPVLALAVFDDGHGAALFAGGTFLAAGHKSAHGIARWDGERWHPLGEGLERPLGAEVHALAVFDGGAGPALYAGGLFDTADGKPARNVARWDGTTWSPLGLGVEGQVRALAPFDDGSGSGAVLVAGGELASAGGSTVHGIAAWDGSAWSALGAGVAGVVHALEVSDAGPSLYAGGDFDAAGGAPARDVARWDGRAWSALGVGLGAAAGHAVHALALHDDGSGPALFAGGTFDGEGLRFLARWDGSLWAPVPGALCAAWSFAVHDDGSGVGPRLYAGGVTNSRIGAWDGQAWEPFGPALGEDVRALAAFDDGSGSGPALYAAGRIVHGTGDLPILAQGFVARFDGDVWHVQGDLTNGVVSALIVHDDGSGPALYAGGNFDAPANHVMRWDGGAWSAVGSGLDGSVRALAIFDDGSGAPPQLIAGGLFQVPGDATGNHVAAWDGAAWRAIGGGTNDWVNALGSFDDGGGPALYAGGEFTVAGGASARRVARWDGHAWSALGSGSDGPVNAFATYDDGAGPALYAGGEFPSGSSTAGLARWDGASWSAIPGAPIGEVNALAVLVDGSGPALHVGGEFQFVSGTVMKMVARWDGSAWSALGAGLSDRVSAMLVHDDGAGPALFLGGLFAVSPAGDSYVARWGCASIQEVPGCFGNPAELVAGSSAIAIGTTFPASLHASGFAAGAGALFLGQDGTDAGGCGLFVPSIGELLLDTTPVLLATAPLAGGAAAFDLPVPGSVALVGLDVRLQGVAIGFGAGTPIELSNGLTATISG